MSIIFIHVIICFERLTCMYKHGLLLHPLVHHIPCAIYAIQVTGNVIFVKSATCAVGEAPVQMYNNRDQSGVLPKTRISIDKGPIGDCYQRA